MNRIAVIADIHANIWALEAVLEHAKQRGITQFVNVGDVLYGPLRPRATYDRLMQESSNVLLTVQGNQDRQVCEAAASQDFKDATTRHVVEDLGPDAVSWLRQLPATGVVDDLFLCHGTPASDSTYLLEDVSSGSPVVRSDEGIRELLGAVSQPVILCGHTHVQRVVRLSHGQMIVSSGSVGLPAYTSELPVPHAMQSYSPAASYAIVEQSERGWNVSLERVSYDYEPAVREARKHGREDWVRALATGRVVGAEEHVGRAARPASRAIGGIIGPY